MTKINNLGLYIHIPFCVRKCRYCDFLSFGCNDSKAIAQYMDVLIEEVKLRSEDLRFREVDSIYIGGGTPSLVSEWDMGRLMDCLKDNYNVTKDAEVTIEANPATLSDEKMERYLRKGINRLSLGVQSFENDVLKFLGRIHSKNDAFYSFQKARKMGFENINMDIMFGIPGQTMKMWKDTVRQCIFSAPEHISLYSLQIEEGTEFYEMYKSGRMEAVSDVKDREMYHTALSMMRDAGYRQYEISNISKPGRESRHNMKYWSYKEYLGMGLGASSFLGGKRFTNCSDLYTYTTSVREGRAPLDDDSVKNYTRRDEMGIFIFTGLRKCEGIALEQFSYIFGEELFDVYDSSILRRFKDLLVCEDGRLYLTEKGMDISNRIMAEFV